MTKITHSHRLGNRALLAVSDILDRVGALAETVKNDYGEDLLVQTQLNDEADTFRIFIQVKGTVLKRRRGGYYSVRIDVDHLRRWVSHIEPVLVCVYDQGSKNVYAFSPRRMFSLWKLSTTNKKSLLVRLCARHRFNEDTARRFIWASRIGHFSQMLSLFETAQQYSAFHGLANERAKDISREANLIVFEFLRSIRVIVGDSFDNQFVKWIKNASHNLSRKDKRIPLRAAFMLVLLNHVNTVCGVGLPPNLMERGTDMCGVFFRQYHRKIWKDITRLFPGDPWQAAPRAGASGNAAVKTH